MSMNLALLRISSRRSIRKEMCLKALAEDLDLPK